MTAKEMNKSQYFLVRHLIKYFAKVNVWVYQKTNGRIMNKMSGSEICLITMTGAKSGEKRTLPLMYVPYKEGVVIVASLGGAPKNPVWFNNVVAHPQIDVQYHDKKMKLVARQVYGEERANVWPTCVKYYKPYESYQRRTNREIPLFVCEPA
ncbi:MAG: nitroreductase family deazaflavin-dependent oxidoreductase [Pseudomonadales bacterium]|nr:nitroreductase family deazaflavin-dependent oxidoreductase [Pseudomonadales bacterium]